MKRRYLFTCMLLVALHTAVPAQLVVGTTKDNFFTTIYLTDVTGKVIPTMQSTDIEGSPLLSDEWNMGSVKFKADNRRADSIQLKFNIPGNTLYFLRDGTTYEFVDDVYEFTMNLSAEGKVQPVVYRNGYPATGKQTTITFYEVLAEGPRVQLLRHTEKLIAETYVYNSPPKKHYDNVSTLYVYDAVAQKISKIKLKRSSVTDALPELEKKIDQLCEQHQWDLKSVEELKQLVLQL